ncbi:MAG: AI-2E family transporter [Sphingobacteriales bacterium]|jgi:predicted PurR-regulated permease PerM|nr:AI-2E family transporter [Sphingobacteriales bacterium]
MSIYNTKQQRIIILILILLLGTFLAYSLKDIISAGLGAIVLYTLLRSYYIKLINIKKWKRPLAALFIILVSFIVLIIPFFTLSWMVINKISYYTDNSIEITNILNHFSTVLGIDVHSVRVMEIIQKVESWALGSFPSIVSALANIFFLVSIMYFILYFMFTEHEYFENALLKYLPFKEKNALQLADELQRITQSNVIGQGIIAFAQGFCVGIGFLIFGIEDPLFWGVLSALLSFVPLVGAALVFVPAGLIEISYTNYYSGVGILIWGVLIVSNIDNVLRLIINRKMANIHPLISIIGVIIGIPMFGILGLVFGPLLISFFILLISIYENKNSTASIYHSRIIINKEDEEHQDS